MCTARAEIGVSIPPEAPEGSGSIVVSYKGHDLATTSLAVKRLGQQQQQTQPIQLLLQNIQLLAASVVFALIVFMAIRYVRGRRSG